MVSESDVLDSMRHIVDPDLGRDIVSLGFVKQVQIEGGTVRFTVELTTPACPVKETFRARCEEAVRALPGVEHVEVRMTAMPARQRPGAGINTLETVDAVIAVSSAKGGVGKSTVAAHLARAMQRQGLEVGLLDADVYGPSVPTLFNIRHPQMYMHENRIIPVESGGLKLMSLGFLLGEAPAVLRGPIVSGYVQQILKQTEWGKLDYLIIDMPPGTGDIQLTITQQASLDGAIIVTTPQALSLVDVARGILMFEKVDVPVLGIVENMSYFDCECGRRHHLFGSSSQGLQERFGLQTLAELPIIPGFSELDGVNTGGDHPAMRAMAESVHRQVGKRRVEQPAHPNVVVHPGHVEVTWPDGFAARIPNKELRAACRCAHCVDEHTGAQILDVNSIAETIQVEAVQPLGNYAVSLGWSDGHTTGIYAWDYLRRIAESVGAM